MKIGNASSALRFRTQRALGVRRQVAERRASFRQQVAERRPSFRHRVAERRASSGSKSRSDDDRIAWDASPRNTILAKPQSPSGAALRIVLEKLHRSRSAGVIATQAKAAPATNELSPASSQEIECVYEMQSRDFSIRHSLLQRNVNASHRESIEPLTHERIGPSANCFRSLPEAAPTASTRLVDSS